MKRKLLVKDYMTTKTISLIPNENIEVAFSKLGEGGVRQAPVIDGEKLVGIITDRDIRMALVEYTDHPDIRVENVMTKDPFSVKEDMKIEEAARLILEKKINALPVVNEASELKGILTTTDIIRGFISFCKN